MRSFYTALWGYSDPYHDKHFLHIMWSFYSPLSEAPVTLDTLPLFQHAAPKEPTGEAQNSKCNSSRGIIVLYSPPTVGAVVANKVFILLFVFCSALVAPAIHYICRLFSLVFFCTLTLGWNLHAVQTLSTTLSHTLHRFRWRSRHCKART